MTTRILNLTNSTDLVANSISLIGPDGSSVDITDLFATQEQLVGGNIQLANYATNASVANSISSFITPTTTALTNYPTTNYLQFNYPSYCLQCNSSTIYHLCLCSK